MIATQNTDPYHNQALEEYLLETVNEEDMILYLWQNQKTVVIGRNQDASYECNIARLEKDGGHLARRTSGGGAVYHDLGNLNFTFLCHKENYDKQKQNTVILNALKKLGIDAEINGRNDLTINERKFSGHAYLKKKDACYHHGTLMVDVNNDDLSKYLNVSMLKLQNKMVDSVRSRIINLKELKDDLSIKELSAVLIEAFGETYEGEITYLREDDLDKERISELREKFADGDWRYGSSKNLPLQCEKKFDWGLLRITYELKEEKISDIEIYTDCLDVDCFKDLPSKLKGRQIDDTLYSGLTDEEKAIAEMLEKKL